MFQYNTIKVLTITLILQTITLINTFDAYMLLILQPLENESCSIKLQLSLGTIMHEYSTSYALTGLFFLAIALPHYFWLNDPFNLKLFNSQKSHCWFIFLILVLIPLNLQTFLTLLSPSKNVHVYSINILVGIFDLIEFVSIMFFLTYLSWVGITYLTLYITAQNCNHFRKLWISLTWIYSIFFFSTPLTSIYCIIFIELKIIKQNKIFSYSTLEKEGFEPSMSIKQ